MAKEEAISTEPCEDAINREDTLRMIDSVISEYNDNETSDPYKGEKAVVKIMQKIINLPSVIPKQKIGRLEWVQYDSNPNIGNWHCSECNRIVSGAVFANPLYKYKYCPYCGAKMESEETK